MRARGIKRAPDGEPEATADATANSKEGTPAQPGGANAAAKLNGPAATAVESGPVETGPVEAGPVEPLVSNARPAGPLSENERRARSIANLEKIGKALTAYLAKRKQLPPAGIPRDGELLLSWRVIILPELGYPELYLRFKQDAPWDSPQNKLLLEYIPPEYQSPERFDATTNYLGVTGRGMVIAGEGLEGVSSGTHVTALRDGADNTVAVVEVDDKYAVEWTRPADHAPQLAVPLDRLGGLRGEGAFAVLASGRVVLLPRELSASRLAALFTSAGGEPVGAADFLKPPTAQPPPPMVATLPDDPTVANQATPQSAPGEGGEPTPAEAVAAPEQGPKRLPGSEPYVPNPAKEPVPDEESLAKARALLKELYEEDYRQARTPDKQREFLTKLRAEISSVEGNAADYHELVRIIRDLAASLGEVPQALAACELLEQRFQVDSLAMRLEVLQTVNKNVKSLKSLQPALTEARRVEREAEQIDRYEIAVPALELVVWFTRVEANPERGDGQGPRGSVDKETSKELARLQHQTDSLLAARGLFVAAERGLARFQEHGQDAAANQAVGEYLCLVKDRWQAGLPYLALAGDIRLRGIASLELAENRSLQETLSLAEQCWDLAPRFKQPQRRGLHLRAAYHYALVKSRLAAGLESVKAQRRIDEAASLYGQEEIDRVLAPLGLAKVVEGEEMP
jgi:hypothetical protein